jgi:Flp pilus assembly protein CpaB
MTKSRLRNLALPLALATLAAVLVGIYVISYRNSVTHGAGLVKVLVASRDIPAGTGGSTIAGGGYLTTQTIPRRAVAPGSITSAAAVTSMITGDQIYKGQQVSLRQFVPITQGGIFAKFSGTQRIVVIPGDPNQLLAGTVSDGDRVDVVATTKYHVVGGIARASTRVVLHNLLVLKAPEGAKSAAVGGTTTATATFVMTDQEAQTFGWAMKEATWFLVLRPTNHPRESKANLETLFSFLARGLNPSAAPGQIAGNFSEAPDGP